jgi:hypothetical protein
VVSNPSDSMSHSERRFSGFSSHKFPDIGPPQACCLSQFVMTAYQENIIPPEAKQIG